MSEKERLLLEIEAVLDMINKTKSEDGDYSQTVLISKFNEYLSQTPEQLTDSEKKGLCAGFSIFYLFMRITERKELYFKNIAAICSYKASQSIDEATDQAFQKALNHVRWLQGSLELIRIKQTDFNRSLAFIADHPIRNEFVFSFVANRDEFINFCEQVIPNNRITYLSNSNHAMGLYKVNNAYFFYDVNLDCKKEISVANANDLYNILLLQRVGYQLEILKGFNLHLYNPENGIACEEVIYISFDAATPESFQYQFKANNEIYKGSIELKNLEGFVAEQPLTVEQLRPFKQQILQMLPAHTKNYRHIPNYVSVAFVVIRLGTQEKINYPNPVDLLKKYHAQDKNFFARRGQNNKTILSLNSQHYHHETFNYLLQQPDVINEIDERDVRYWWTPLMICVQDENLEAISSLIKAGAKVNSINYHGQSPLHIAILVDSVNAIRLLINCGADIYCYYQKINRSPLFQATSAHLDTFKELYSFHKEKGGQVDIIENKESLLYAAVANNNLPVAQFLLEENADVNFLGDLSCERIVNVAAEKSTPAMVELLIQNNAEISQANHPVLSAAKGGKLESIKYFEKNYQISPILYGQAASKALSENNLPVAQYLISKISLCSGSDLLTMILKKEAPLQHFALLKILLQENKVNLCAYDSINKRSLLSWAKENQNTDLAPEAKECINLVLQKIEKPLYTNILQFITKSNQLSQQLHCEGIALNKYCELRFFGGYIKRSIDLKKDKANYLMRMVENLSHDPLKPIAQIVQKIEKECPRFLSGFFSHRVKDFVNEIEGIQKNWTASIVSES